MINAQPSVNAGTFVQSAHITSNFRSGQSHHPQNQPQYAQNRRHVSFAEKPRNPASVDNMSIQEATTKLESEDNFDFGDDESFLAALGMEDDDFGRPIETDADLGRPIDHEEVNLPLEGDISVPISDTDGLGNDISRNDTGVRVQRLQEIEKATNANTLNTSPPLKQCMPLEQIQNVTSSSTLRISSTIFRPLDQVNQPNIIHAQQRNHRPFARPAISHDQNENENLLSNSNESGAKRPMATTSSMGGFHFPPGMVHSIWGLSRHAYLLICFFFIIDRILVEVALVLREVWISCYQVPALVEEAWGSIAVSMGLMVLVMVGFVGQGLGWDYNRLYHSNRESHLRHWRLVRVGMSSGPGGDVKFINSCLFCFFVYLFCIDCWHICIIFLFDILMLFRTVQSAG